jgi:hypothetical protein
MDPATLYMIAMLADGSMRVSSDHFEDREVRGPCEAGVAGPSGAGLVRARPQALGQDGPVSAVNAAVVL